MKKLCVIMTALLLSVVLVGCGEEKTTTTTTTTEPTEVGNFDVADGYYFAVADEFANGYKYWVVVSVEDKIITDIDWNGYHIDGGAGKCQGYDKVTCSELGIYGMNGSKGEWHTQAENATDWILVNQTLDVTADETGHIDAITTVSVHSEEMFDLVEAALENDPVAEGSLANDGYYYKESDLTDKTVTYAIPSNAELTAYETFAETFSTSTFGVFVVVNGTVVLADFNARHDAYEYVLDNEEKFVKQTIGEGSYNTINGAFEEGVFVPTKKYVTKDSAGIWYGMANVWADQAAVVEEKLLADQTLTADVDGNVDGVTGVSIHTNGFLELFNELVTEANAE